VNEKILLIDDDPVFARVTEKQLLDKGYAVTRADSIKDAEECILRAVPDIVLLDVVLEDGDGPAFCRKLRQCEATAAVPVLLVTAHKSAEDDQISGLESGADDYLIKPLSPRLLYAKIDTVLRRFAALNTGMDVMSEYGLGIDISARMVTKGKRKVKLTRKELDMLSAFINSRGRVLSPRLLLETIWGYNTEIYNNPRTVEVHVSRLRQKLGRNFAARLQTVSGAGYRLD